MGHRHGNRTRSLTGTFGPVEIEVPRARLNTPEGRTTEWKSQALRAYQRRTLAADALIASCYLAGTHTRRVRRALAALFGGTVGKACSIGAQFSSMASSLSALVLIFRCFQIWSMATTCGGAEPCVAPS
jgi:transposase-like protein